EVSRNDGTGRRAITRIILREAENGVMLSLEDALPMSAELQTERRVVSITAGITAGVARYIAEAPVAGIAVCRRRGRARLSIGQLELVLAHRAAVGTVI